jgi:hypothetical protein
MQSIKKVVKKKEQPVPIKKAVKKKEQPAAPVKKTQVNKKTPSKKKAATFPKLGQIKAAPPENDALRRFYTSLLKQNPKSEMATKWCVEHGLYPQQEDNIHIALEKLSI